MSNWHDACDLIKADEPPAPPKMFAFLQHHQKLLKPLLLLQLPQKKTQDVCLIKALPSLKMNTMDTSQDLQALVNLARKLNKNTTA